MKDADGSTANPLFPMRLSSIEQFHFHDDSTEFPNSLFCRIRLKGQIDREKAVEAIRFFESRHPLICTAVRQRGNRLVWDGSFPPSKNLRWIETSSSPNFEQLDLTRKSGVQLLFVVSDSFTEFWAQAHHATVDGGAGIQVINDWMMAYGNLVAGRPVDSGFQSLAPEKLRKRNSLGILKWNYLRHLYKQPLALYGASKFIFRRFGLLTQAAVDRASPVVLHNQFPTILGRWIKPETLVSLREQAARHGVMMNTILMAHLYMTIGTWRTRHQVGRPDDWIRVILPMSIRTVSDRWLPACNRSVVVQVDRQIRQFEDVSAFIRGLDQEVGIIRAWHLHKMFLLAIRGMSVVPSWLKASAKQSKFRGTIVFANLGNPFSRNKKLQTERGICAGDLELVDFDWVGPVRKGIGANLSVQQHGDRLRLSLHVDPRQLDVPVAERFLEDFAMRLETLPF